MNVPAPVPAPVPVDPGITTPNVVTGNTPSPLTRWYRTIVQVLATLIIVTPIAAEAFGVTEVTASKYTTLMAGGMTVISAAHNAWNAQQAKKA